MVVTEVTCTFDLQNYPFDNQECFLILVNKGSNRNIVQLIPPLKVAYNGDTNFLNYIIEKPIMLDTRRPSCLISRNCSTYQGNTIRKIIKYYLYFINPDRSITYTMLSFLQNVEPLPVVRQLANLVFFHLSIREKSTMDVLGKILP